MSARYLIATLTFLLPAVASAVDVPCGLADKGAVVIDGLLDDWSGVEAVGVGGSSRDASMTLSCNTDGKTLWLMFDAKDERLIRNKKAGQSDDMIILGVAGGKARIFPAHPDLRIPRKVTFQGKSFPMKTADGLTERGWAVEVSIPLAKLPGFRKGTPTLPLAVAWADADLLSENRAQETYDVGPSQLVFADLDAVFRSFLEQHRLRAGDVKLDVLVDLDGHRGVERVVWAGRIVGVLTDEAGYLVLPAQPKDVLEVRAIDAEGKGTSLIAARYLEHGGGGSREVLAIFTARGGGLERMFAHELSKKTTTMSLTNTAKWVPAGRKKKGFALEIALGEARGVYQETWREAPAEDMVPVLLPWGEAKKERWEFADGEIRGGPVTK